MIPIDYVSRQEAAEIIAAAKLSGVPDRPAVIEARSAGFNTADGSAEDEAIIELWRAVDKGTLEVAAHGPGDRWLKMSAEETKRVPLLRATRGGNFTFLRPGNPFHEIVVSQFGSRLGLISLVFPRRQVEALARQVRRRRRRSLEKGGGRPSRQNLVRPIVRKLVEEGRWNPTMPLKTLARQVERAQKWPKVPSEDTVTRVLDHIYDEEKDRRFQRVRRKPQT
jgi:hypothetical protein